MTCEQLLTEYTNSGLRCHLHISRHHILNGKTPSILLSWNETQGKKILSEISVYVFIHKRLIKSNPEGHTVHMQNTWMS